MKRVGLGSGLGLGALLLAASVFMAAPKGKTFTGEIMDNQCAAMGSHSPAGYQMTKTDNPKAAPLTKSWCFIITVTYFQAIAIELMRQRPWLYVTVFMKSSTKPPALRGVSD